MNTFTKKFAKQNISQFKKSFSTAKSIDLFKLNSPPSEVIKTRLINRDIDFFTNYSENFGATKALQLLEQVSFDSSTKFGRDLIVYKNEVINRISFHARDIEEHENVSSHISEAELSKVYKAHLSNLESRATELQSLKKLSDETSDCLFEYKTSSPKYTIIPALASAISIGAIGYYSSCIAAMFGGGAPLLLSLGAIWAGMRRVQWLRGGDRMIKGTVLVKRLHLKEDKIVIEDFKRKTHTLNFSSTSVSRVENEVRRESYYVIRDAFGQSKFILPLVEDAVADEKTLNWFAHLRRSHDDYSIRQVLHKGDKLIDVNQTLNIRKEVDTMARINLLKSQGIELSTMTNEELNMKVNSLSDQKVAQYLEQVSAGTNASASSLESNLVSVQNLLFSYGLNLEEAEKMTRYLRDNYKINSVKDLKFLSSAELEEAFSESVSNSNLSFDVLRSNLKTFFK